MSLSENDKTAPLSPLKALGVLVILAVLILGFVALCTTLGIKNFWVGFLFMFYWLGLEDARLDRLLPAVLGALTGLLVSYSVGFFSLYLAADQAALAGFCLSLLIIYVRLIGRLKVFSNLATMLFLTVGSIPFVHSGITMQEMFTSLLLGILFFGLIGGTAGLLAQRKATRQTGV